MAKSKVNEHTFEAVKKLTAGGATISEISVYLGLCHATVSRIRAAKTFDEYKAPQKKKEVDTEKKQDATQVVEYRQTVQVQATHYMMEELKKTNELLSGISRKLAAIIEDLYGVKGNAESDH